MEPTKDLSNCELVPCPEWTRRQSDNSCKADVCKSNQKVLITGSCKDCLSGMEPDKSQTQCVFAPCPEYTRR